MKRAAAIVVVVLTGCDQVYNLTRPPDARVDDAGIDTVDAPPLACDFEDASPPHPVPAKATGIVAGMFDGDDSMDLAVGSTNAPMLWIFANDNADFGTIANHNIGEPALALAAGDIDNDGLDDIAFVTATTANAFLQTASSWDRRTVDLIGGPPTSVALANFDGSGLDDMVLALPSGDFVQVVVGGPLSYMRGQSIPSIGPSPAAAISAYVDGDLDLDIVVALQNENGLRTFIDDGANFVPGSFLPTGTKPVALAAARLGDRQVLDLIAANETSNDLTILRNDGNGVFAPGGTLPVGMGPRAIAVADLDRDGFADILVVNHKSNSFSLVRGTATGFELSRNYTTASKPVSLAIADVTNDGHLDVAVLGEDDGFVIHTMVCAPL